MKTINLNKYLINDEFILFNKIVENYINVEEIDNSLDWKFFNEVGNWVKKCKNSKLLISELIKPQQKITIRGYKKIIYPLIKKYGATVIGIMGTELGLRRNGKLIPHDDDLDLGIEIEDFRKYATEIQYYANKNRFRLRVFGWFSDGSFDQNGQPAARLYANSKINVIVGNYKIALTPNIDLWPIMSYSGTNYDDDYYKYKINIGNIVDKKFFKYPWHTRLINENPPLKYLDYAKGIQLETSISWINEFILNNYKLKSSRYFYLEKDITGRGELIFENDYAKVKGAKIYLPKFEEENLVKRYGSDWRVEKIGHLHSFRLRNFEKIL